MTGISAIAKTSMGEDNLDSAGAFTRCFGQE
jgi:hypothetical protein